MINGKRKIESLTGARLFAIALIVLGHFEFLGNYFYGEFYNTYLSNAQMGVDFFFMLSGFGMMLSYMQSNQINNNVTLRGMIKFAFRHVKKIYPIYILTLLFCVPMQILNLIYKYSYSFTDAIQVITLKFFAALTLLQSLTGTMYFSHAINGVCWFLSTLFCIYLVCPFILKFIKRSVNNTKSATFVATLCVALSFVLAILFQEVESHTVFDDLVYGSPYRRVFYVICGMAVSQIYTFRKKNTPVYVDWIVILTVIFWFLERNTIRTLFGSYTYLIDMVLCGICLYTIATSEGVLLKILGCEKMVCLGEMSMYIYLIHYPIRNCMDFAVNFLNLQSPAVGIVESVCICVSTFVLSFVIYKHENIFTVEYLKKKIKSNK